VAGDPIEAAEPQTDVDPESGNIPMPVGTPTFLSGLKARQDAVLAVKACARACGCQRRPKTAQFWRLKIAHY